LVGGVPAAIELVAVEIALDRFVLKVDHEMLEVVDCAGPVFVVAFEEEVV